MAKKEFYSFTINVVNNTANVPVQFEVPVRGRIRQVMFQAQHSTSMALTFILRVGSDFLIPSNASAQPIRTYPVVMDVDFAIPEEGQLNFLMSNGNQQSDVINIVLVIEKETDLV